MSNGVDTRELILERLAVLLGEVSGIQSTWRNRGDLTDIERPAAIVLDGRERLRNPVEDVYKLKTVKMPTAIFTLEPQIFVALQMRDDVTNLTVNQVSDPVGPELSMWRMLVKDAVINDSVLLDLVTVNGQIIYKGCDTDMQTGSMIGALGAEMQFFFEFCYVLFPSQG
jgi:hypothetical protein